MNYLAENAVPIWASGAVLVTLALVVFFQTRNNSALGAALGFVLVAAALLALEWHLETPREAVERTLGEIAAAIEANDLPRVLTYIAPQAALPTNQVRTDAATLMPLVVVEKARILGTPDIQLDDAANPLSAVAYCQAMVHVVVKQNGMKGPYMDRVTINFTRDGERWLIVGYTPAHDWRKELR